MSHPDGAATPLRALMRLRWAAVAAQVLAIAVVTQVLDIALPLLPLLAGAAALASFNLLQQVLIRRHFGVPVLVALMVDLLVLTWQLYWSGGPANPFVSLYVVPIALAAVWRSPRSVLVTALVAVGAYSALWFRHEPLPHVHGEFDLHLFGMWVNFLLTALVVGWFGVRVARTLARQREALRAARERSLRDEGVLAVATLAAGAAHALNTPLATMAVILGDWRDVGLVPEPLRDDAQVLANQVDACRDAVRELVAESRSEAAPVRAPLRVRVTQAVTRWQLLRPAFALRVSISDAAGDESIAIDRGFDHLLAILLNNAADAAESASRRDVTLAVHRDADRLVLDVGDPGPGFAAATRPFASTKSDGLGLGLTLAELICERHDGGIAIASDADGTRVRAWIAWPNGPVP